MRRLALILIFTLGCREPVVAIEPPDPIVVAPHGGVAVDVPVLEEAPPADVTTELPPDVLAERDALLDEVGALDSLTTDQLQARRAVTHVPLPYDPLTAVNMDLVQASALALDDPQRARLGRDGFVIRDDRQYPSYAYGYQEIYLLDLPVFISADSILEAVHRSYDDILKGTELRMLVPELLSLLASMRETLRTSEVRDQVSADLDLYLTVAYALLRGTEAWCIAGCSSADAQRFVDMAVAHEGAASIVLFGTPRDEDFSQYEPRGHYEELETLQRYFRAMMWLGRVDLRILETQPDHSQLFHRRQLMAAFGLRSIMNDEALATWNRIDAVITAFVGEHDYMILSELDSLLSDLGVTSAAELATLSDQEIAQAIVDGGYGTQRISSHIMINGTGEGTMPLSSSFAFLGQRYVVDSHVFSNVVYDRVRDGAVRRMMPSTLDVAYAALANDEAARLLDTELRQYSYAPDLESMRVLVDAHGPEYWRQDLYTSWLGSLRALSPSAAAPDGGLPSVARTEAWSRRILNTQLASWAELRHDTILYAKQSYTGGATCEFPDGYVEPYPAFFEALVELARRGQAAMTLTGSTENELLYFQRLEEIATTLATMARAQRSGTPFNAEQLAFINQAVTIEFVGCDGQQIGSGWYGDLHYDREHGVQLDPTIADVHTQPTDAAGNPVGHVLHVATGQPRLAVFTFETCEGPRAYVGLVSSYFERVTSDFQRLTDSEWLMEIQSSGHPSDPSFLGDLVLR